MSSILRELSKIKTEVYITKNEFQFYLYLHGVT